MDKSTTPKPKAAVPPKAMFKAAAAMFANAAKAGSTPGKLPGSLRKCAAELTTGSQALRKQFGPDYDGRLVDRLAEYCASLSDALTPAGSDAGSAMHGLIAAAAATEGTFALSEILVAMAESVRNEPEGRAPEPAASDIREQFGQTAHGLFVASLALREAAGMPPAGIKFRWPRAGSCGCGGFRGVATDGAPPQSPLPPAPASEPDADAVKRAEQRLRQELMKLFALLALLARYFPAILAYFDEYYYQACSQDCTGPTGRIIAIRRTASYSTTGAVATPLADASVDLCCSNPCLVVSTEWDVETVAVTAVTVGNPFGVGREAAAVAFAGGAAALAKLRAAITAAPPACPP